MTVFQERFQKFLEVKQLRQTVDQCHVVDTERRLELCHLEQFVQNNAGIGIALDVDDNAHTRTVALVVDVGNTVEFLVLHQFGNRFNQLSLVDIIRYFVYYNLVVVFF